MQVITTAVIKGGTGKSTTAAALAQAAAADGRKVLVIDMDPQGNLSYFVGADPEQAGSFQLLEGKKPESMIQHTAQGIDAIPASPDLATVHTAPGSAKRLQQAIEPIKKDYDFIIIDTPPALGDLTYNALQAATRLIIPLETDTSSLQGLYQVTDIAHRMHRSNQGLSSIGIVITKFDGRAKLNRYMLDTIRVKGEEAGADFLATIRPGIAIREAQAMQESIFTYAPKSKPAQDYKALYEHIRQED